MPQSPAVTPTAVPSIRSSSAAATSAVATLREGMSGPQVKAWQEDLLRLGFLSQSEYQTGPGIFGPKTKAATARLQTWMKLESSGIAGPLTQEAMKKLVAQRNTFATSPLRVGMTGERVKGFQQLLVKAGFLTQAEYDTGPGTFGPRTQAAVRRLQGAAGLQTSGVVDAQTFSALVRHVSRGATAPTPYTPVTPGPGQTFNVPYINQLTSPGSADDWNRLSNCGPATVAMIAKGFGIHRDWVDGTLVNHLGSLAGVGAAGTGADGVAAMARGVGLKAEVRWGDQVAWIRSQLQAGKLVAANGNRSVTLANGGNGAKWGYGAGGHWIAVVGMDSAGNFLVMDPSTDCRKLSPSELSRYFRAHEYGGSVVAISR